MEFYNNTSLESITDKEVTVFLRDGKPNTSSCGGCRVILVDGEHHIDFIPRFNGKHIAPLPSDAMVSQATDGTIGIFIYPNTDAAQLLLLLWKQQRIIIAQSN